MPVVVPGRQTARIEGDFVVFLIGMRVNRLLAVHKWLPVTRAMPAMLAELRRQPALGLLHVEGYFGGRTLITVQYWRSFDHLHAYAHARDMAHLPAWAAFNRRAKGNAAVGVFHETYLVAAGQYECVHVHMPRQGLLSAGEPMPVGGPTDTARQRLAPPTDASGADRPASEPGPSAIESGSESAASPSASRPAGEDQQ